LKRSTSLSIAAAATILGVSSFAAAQYPQPGYPQPGYAPQPAYPQPGYAPQPAYPQPAYPQPAYPQPAYPQPAQPAYPQPGYAPQPGYTFPQPFTIPLPGFGYGASAPGYGGPPAYSPPPPPPPTFFAESMQSRVALQFDWFNSSPSGAQSLNALTWDLVAQVGVTENIFLDADLPWSYSGQAAGDFSSGFSKAVFGLPILGAHLAARFAPSAAFSVGMAIGVPVQGTMNQEGQVAAALAGSLRGYQDIYRFFPNQLPLRFRGSLELESKPFYLQADLALAFLISMSQSQTTIVTLDQGTNVGVRTSFGLVAGLRLQESFALTTAQDHVQVAIEPFVGYESPKKIGLIARYGLLMPLDSVEGFAFDKGKLLTNRFTIGAKF
jgi:hypothetical protein